MVDISKGRQQKTPSCEGAGEIPFGFGVSQAVKPQPGCLPQPIAGAVSATGVAVASARSSAGRLEVEDMTTVADPALLGRERRAFAITDVHGPTAQATSGAQPRWRTMSSVKP